MASLQAATIRCLNIVIESKDDATNEAANASPFDHLLHPSQQTMQNAVT